MKIQPTIEQLRMLSAVRGEIWAMHEDRVQELALACLDAGEKSISTADMAQFFPMREQAAMHQTAGGQVAVIPVQGSLVRKAPRLYEELGLVTRYQTVIDETLSAEASGASGIVYVFDSPGGTVAGVSEAGEAIAGATVPTVALCDGLTCSAAYWLASQCKSLVATPSAEVGNIGAILSWADCSGFWSEMGVEFKALVSEGAVLKSTFHLEPDETQVEFLQERINEAGRDFQAAVVAGRGEDTLDDEVWRAGWYSGERAVSLGLVDEIGGLEEALAHFTS